MADLKPCPFCGNSEKVKVIIHQFATLSDSYGVECFNCKTQSYQYFDTETEAVKAWNTRAKMEVEHEISD